MYFSFTLWLAKCLNMPACAEPIEKKIDRFMEACAGAPPAVVVLAMHEFARNLYPTDPFIPFRPGHRLDAIDTLLDPLTQFVSAGQSLGAYPIPDAPLHSTAEVYGKLWDQYPDNIVDEAAAILEARFSHNRIDAGLIRGKTVLDAGCGSGRYTCALAKMGAVKVVGVDFGDLDLARRLSSGLPVEYCEADLLDLPFGADFDFIYCNGVAHHTSDMKACINEVYRVLKPGGAAWLYVYGDGGVFWYARAEMNRLMKSIPQDFAMTVLSAIGMPPKRFIFADNWYVPIEIHTYAADFEAILRRVGFSEFRRCEGARDTDFDVLALHGTEKDRAMWGDGECRYLARK